MTREPFWLAGWLTPARSNVVHVYTPHVRIRTSGGSQTATSNVCMHAVPMPCRSLSYAMRGAVFCARYGGRGGSGPGKKPVLAARYDRHGQASHPERREGGGVWESPSRTGGSPFSPWCPKKVNDDSTGEDSPSSILCSKRRYQTQISHDRRRKGSPEQRPGMRRCFESWWRRI